MTQPSVSPIPSGQMSLIYKHAEKTYPEECCGFIVGPIQSSGFSQARPCRNIQETMRKAYPSEFPRSAREAFFMDPKEILTVQKECRMKGERIKVIYHSHADSEPIFSVEDRRFACYKGAPVYPDVQYLILSVYKSRVRETRLFTWDETRKDFIA